MTCRAQHGTTPRSGNGGWSAGCIPQAEPRQHGLSLLASCVVEESDHRRDEGHKNQPANNGYVDVLLVFRLLYALEGALHLRFVLLLHFLFGAHKRGVGGGTDCA